MTPSTLDTNPQATLAAAIARDAVVNEPAGNGTLSHLSVAFRATLPYDREKSLAARSSTVAIALADSPSKRIRTALDAAHDLFNQAREIARKITEADVGMVRAHYARLHGAASVNPRLHAKASRGLVDGDPNALAGIEPEADIATRVEAEINARQSAMSALGFQAIEHAAVIRNEIDSALAKLVSGLQAKDAESSKRYGVETDYSAETRLAASVRILFARATFHLPKLEKAAPAAGPFDYGLFRNTFRDYLPEVAAW